MTPSCTQQDHQNLSGRCPICGHIVPALPDHENVQQKSLQGAEDLRKILP